MSYPAHANANKLITNKLHLYIHV